MRVVDNVRQARLTSGGPRRGGNSLANPDFRRETTTSWISQHPENE